MTVKRPRIFSANVPTLGAAAIEMFELDLLPEADRAEIEQIRKKVSGALRHHLRIEVPYASYEIAIYIHGEFKCIDGVPSIEEGIIDDTRLRLALNTVIEVISKRIRHNACVARDTDTNWRKTDSKYATDAGQLVEAAKQFLPRSPPRKPSARSRWHIAARTFAGCIERELEARNEPLPSRDSEQSPLVIAVAELLRLLGVKPAPTDGSVRKALTADKNRPVISGSRRKKSEA